MIENMRNIAIIAHLDHGKTTLVDQLLQQSGASNEWAAPVERMMGSNILEQERGDYNLSEEHGDPVAGLPDQGSGHAGPRGFWE